MLFFFVSYGSKEGSKQTKKHKGVFSVSSKTCPKRNLKLWKTKEKERWVFFEPSLLPSDTINQKKCFVCFAFQNKKCKKTQGKQKKQLYVKSCFFSVFLVSSCGCAVSV